MTANRPARRDVLALAATLTAGALASRSAFAQGAAAPLNFGYQTTSWGTIGMLVEAKGLFKKAGANVTIYKFDGGKTTRDAMISGRIDVGVLGSTPFVVGAAKGDIAAIGMSMYAGKTDAVVAGKNRGIKSVADLKGHAVASKVGSATDDVFRHKILPKYGLTTEDVRILDIPHQNHIAALVSGSVDAFAGVEPFPSLAEVDGVGVTLVDYSAFDILPVFLSANAPLITRERAALIALLRGWLEGVNLFQTRRDEAAKIVYASFKAQGFSVSAEVIQRMLAKLDVTPTFKPELRAYLEDEAKTLMQHNAISAMPDWDKLLNTELMHEAMKA
jgi:ABC-type nitrate/sulfonate/bicarbonate transport system substrate-binding protein